MMKLVSVFKTKEVLVLACLGVAGFAAARWARSHQVHAQPNAKPFTVTRELYRYVKASPVGELYARETVARRSDGLTMTQRTLGPLEAGLTFRKITTMDGKETLVHDALNAKTSFQGTPEEAAQRRNRILNPSPNCVSDQFSFLRNDVVLDHRVAVLLLERGDMRVTRSVAEDLGCEVLGGTYEEKDTNGNWELHQSEKAVKLSVGEPQPSLFEIPDGLVELRPSEASTRYHARLGARENVETQRTTHALDRKYDAERPKPK